MARVISILVPRKALNQAHFAIRGIDLSVIGQPACYCWETL
jgi:hypothetical protein